MSVLCPRTTDTVVVVHASDPNVKAPEGATGWIPRDDVRLVEPGATVLEIGPLNTHEQFRASATLDFGSRVYFTIKLGLRKLGSWQDKGGRPRLVIEDLDEQGAIDALEDLQPLDLKWELYGAIQRLTDGEDLQAPPEPVLGDREDPKKKAGPETDGNSSESS